MIFFFIADIFIFNLRRALRRNKVNVVCLMLVEWTFYEIFVFDGWLYIDIIHLFYLYRYKIRKIMKNYMVTIRIL